MKIVDHFESFFWLCCNQLQETSSLSPLLTEMRREDARNLLVAKDLGRKTKPSAAADNKEYNIEDYRLWRMQGSVNAT